MRLSVSTKIFLGFTVVIIAFGSACAYTIYRMTTLRESVTVVWEEVMPIASQLKDLSRRLRAPEEFLDLRRPTDPQWLTRLLPTLDPFAHTERLEERLEQLTRRSILTEPDSARLRTVLDELRGFRQGPALGRDLKIVAPADLLSNGGTALTSEALFDVLVARTVQKANDGELTGGSREARSMVRALRRINSQVIKASRDVSEPIRDMNERAAADEKAATLAVLVIASGALLLSLAMLLMIRFTLLPIRRLRAGAQQIAAGDYAQRVRVRSMDEIGQLAEEFNRMAEALQIRDRELARQREELLRKDRLATIGKLAAQITHEVRNPLSSIGLNTELLEEELEGDAEASALLAAIQGEVQRLKGITEEYLTYARLPQPDLSEVDVGQLLSSFLSFLAPELDAAGVHLSTHGVAPADGGGPPRVHVDGHQLRQALLNIARNAIEAMREIDGDRRLDVSLEALDDGGVEVAVMDTGAGVEPALRSRIFEPFVTGKAGGTGLGLALTQQIVVDHGGTLRLEDRTDGASGALFRLRLPGGQAARLSRSPYEGR